MFRVTEMTVSDKTGIGNAILTSASGASVLMNGARYMLSSGTANYTISQHESSRTWVNTGSGPITFTLPSNSASGTAAMFVRTGGSLGVNPASAQIWHSTSGLFRPAGRVVYLNSSGAMFGVISDGNNRWYPIIEKGTIS